MAITLGFLFSVSAAIKDITSSPSNLITSPRDVPITKDAFTEEFPISTTKFVTAGKDKKIKPSFLKIS
jgi:hypothetical protein